MSPAQFRVTSRRQRSTLIAAMGVAVIALLALIGYLMWTGHLAAIRSAEVATRNYAAIIEGRLDGTLRRADADLQELRRTLPPAAMKKQALQQYEKKINAELDARRRNFPELAGIRVFDAGGDLLYTDEIANVTRANIGDRPHFRNTRASVDDQPVFADVLVSRITGKPMLILARPVRDAQGGFLGIVTASVEFDYFLNLFRSLDIGPGGVVSIYRTDDFSLVLRWPGSGGKSNVKLSPESPTRRALASGNKNATFESVAITDGIARIYSWQKLDGYPFFAAVGIARDDALAIWNVRAAMLGMTGVLLAAMLFFLTYRLWHAEDTLFANEELMRSTFEQAAVGIAHIDPESFRILRTNDKFCSLLGYAPGELTGTDVRLLTPDDERPQRETDQAQVLAGELGELSGERRLIPKYGAILWVNRNLSVVRDAAGRAQYLIAVIEDISARKGVESELRKSNAFRESLLEATPLPVFYKDAAGRYAGCNKAFTQFIGKPRDAIVGKTVFEVSPSTVAKVYRDRDLDLLTGPVDTQSYESQVMHADGALHDVIFHKARLTDDTGEPTGIVGVITDITEIKKMAAARDQLESQLRESQKMEALGTLAGGIAHDFNNIIATIAGNAELAGEDLGPGHPAQESIAEIRKAGRRAKDLVQQILAFGRRQAIEREVVSLETAIAEATRLLRATLPAGVSLKVDCAADAPMVLADNTQVEQMLINLCTNAWQAMQGRGAGAGVIEIRLHAHEQSGAASTVDLRAGRYACLSVSDNGPGMDAATLERIFEPFFTTKPVGQGTGLGLSVVHSIVQEHGAKIDVQSTPGTGTAFHIYFPAVDAAASAPHAATAGAIPPAASRDDTLVLDGGGKQILYIDDDDAMVLLLTRLLERRGYRVSGYTDAQAALAAVRTTPARFDLAVTDFNMPGMSGLEVARELRDIRADLPVAVISGYLTEELRAEAPAAGVRELIYKPNSVEELSDAIARLIKAEP